MPHDFEKTDYEEVRAHVKYVCGIDLSLQLKSNRFHQVKIWPLVTPLVVLYRYSEAVGEKIRLYGMFEKGHKSHLSGVDLDFGYFADDLRKKAVTQARIVNDMLELRDAITMQSSRIEAFRIGFYFDRFDNDDALKKLLAADDREAAFNKAYAKRNGLSSLHLGVRYRYDDPVYQGVKTSSDYADFGFWGRGGGSCGRGSKWEKVFRDMAGNMPQAQAANVASKILRDLDMLNRRAPGSPLPEPEVPWSKVPVFAHHIPA